MLAAFLRSCDVSGISSSRSISSSSHSVPFTPSHCKRGVARCRRSNAREDDPWRYVDRISRPCGSASTRHNRGTLYRKNRQPSSSHPACSIWRVRRKLVREALEQFSSRDIGVAFASQDHPSGEICTIAEIARAQRLEHSLEEAGER